MSRSERTGKKKGMN